ncbi:hypothetical protein BSZ35_08815 [Salinibacter sp. 10B]|nr:hypothetical protein BSZ35_08815 [Salinibacter sp. 10B]
MGSIGHSEVRMTLKRVVPERQGPSVRSSFQQSTKKEKEGGNTEILVLTEFIKRNLWDGTGDGKKAPVSIRFKSDRRRLRTTKDRV